MIVNASDFNFTAISNADSVPPDPTKRKRRKADTIDIVCAFDIETSYIKDIEQNVLYIWQFQVDDICTVIGRTWEEWQVFTKRLSEAVGSRTLVIYVHNLSYEFQFIRSLYDFLPEFVFCTGSRKILKATMLGNLEFRCSYLHCNMALGTWLAKMGVESQKQKNFDYEKVRLPWTELSEKELLYCVNDVRGLVQAIKKEMALDGDNLDTIPLTSTGYVRRDVRNALKPIYFKISRNFPSLRTFELLRQAFRGGNTHANRHMNSITLEGVRSYDRSSSYPDVQLNCRFPITPFKTVYESVTYERLMNHYITRREYAIIARLRYTGARLRDRFYPCPYIARDKVRSYSGGRLDNGRILCADTFEITVTDIDLKIIDAQYIADHIEVLELQFAFYGHLPEELKEVIRNYYRTKTDLKNVDGQEVYYMKSKNKLNSIYGMSATNPAKEEIVYTPDDPDPDTGNIYRLVDKTLQELLASAHPVLPYQWGVWTTAHARNELQRAIDIVGHDFVYCDTDSVKFIGEHDFTELNNMYRARSEENRAYADDRKGKRYYMGIYENEGIYDKFRTLGAKIYAYETHKDFTHAGRDYRTRHLSITVAGVPKGKGARELAKRGGIDKLEDGFTFHDGVTTTTYNDIEVPYFYSIDGHELMVTSNLTIRPNTHVIGRTEEYRQIITEALKAFDVFNKI